MPFPEDFIATGSTVSSFAPSWVSFASLSAAYRLHLTPVQMTELLRATSDFIAWITCTAICLILCRVAWKLRQQIPIALSGGPLLIVIVGFAVKRIFDFIQLRTTINSVDLRLLCITSTITIILALVVLLLTPFLNRMVDFSLTAREEHQRFLTAAETNLHAFSLLKVIRSPLRGITDFEFLFANAVAEQQLGVAREKLAGMMLSQVLSDVRDSGLFRRLKHVAQTGIPYQGRVKDKSDQGRDLWFHLRAVKTDDGLAVVIRDLSEERQNQRRLEEMNRFSQSIIEDAPFSIIAVNSSGIITAVNGATQMLTQYRRDELVGKHSIVVLHDPAELSSRSITLERETGHPVAAGFDTLRATLGKRKSNESEWSYVRKDGRKIAVHLAMTALRDQENEITGYLAIAFDISERKQLTESISFMAHHDALTKLPNRTLLNTRMQQAIDQAAVLNRRVAVFVVDVDHFKRINDSLGHGAGDELLRLVGERLKQSVRTTDIVARTGGDEFVVMMPNAGDFEDIMRSGQRLGNTFNSPAQIAGRELNITASIGVCVFPDLASDTVSLIRNADTAMYAAKQKGRNQFHAFSEKMLEASADRLELEADLRKAVERNELILHYQPQVNTRTRAITGVEALLRWNHPIRGIVPPLQFIQTAEEGGMIVPIGEWVIRQACMEARKMQVELGRRFIIAVNLSPRQVLQDNLVAVVQEALQTSGLAPEDLELEITENTLMISSSETLTMLARLRELGVRLAVDDFGTGFSSFKYILEYKVDRLKIDRSFTAKCATDATAAAIVRTVIAMAHGLNMTVVAEGVENDDQLAFLLRRRCDEAQGYRFGRPVPMKDLRPLLSGEVSAAPGAGARNTLAAGAGGSVLGNEVAMA
ncbi:MAG: EAL domain-containing protein [Acidobacteriaceae bacterium]|nr:EAL domain-containing protein [Acidobacteriaceae bacterium]